METLEGLSDQPQGVVIERCTARRGWKGGSSTGAKVPFSFLLPKKNLEPENSRGLFYLVSLFAVGSSHLHLKQCCRS